MSITSITQIASPYYFWLGCYFTGAFIAGGNLGLYVYKYINNKFKTNSSIVNFVGDKNVIGTIVGMLCVAFTYGKAKQYS